MTRLTEDDLKQGPVDLKAYNQKLKAITGLGLLELALKTTNMTLEQYKFRAATLSSVAVIPVTTGQGIISGFSEKVADIVSFLGLPCKITKGQDIAGLGEAVVGGSEIIILGDDNTFLALNLISHLVVDNAVATGQIYAAALVAAAGGVAKRSVAVLGLGLLGQAAATWLHSHGAQLTVYDRDQKKQSDFLVGRVDIRGATKVGEVLDQTNLVLDATDSPNIIKVKELKHLILAAPGMPLGIDEPDSEVVRLIHDPLQLGVAAMVVQALA